MIRPDSRARHRLLPEWARGWRATDPLLGDAVAGGELLVARIRLLLTVLLIIIPAANLHQEPWAAAHLIGLGVASGAALVAAVVYRAVRGGLRHRWIAFVTSTWDVTMVSLALTAFLAAGLPHTAVNSRVVFEIYFLAIGATSLRYDVRVCVVAGAVAILQYLAIVAYADAHWRLNDPSNAPFVYGMFDWNTEISRITLLAMMTVLCAAGVARARGLRQLSISDSLTGLHNRAYFDQQIRAEALRAGRHGRMLSVAMIDLDHFKRFNDEFGHGAGDQALRKLADVLERSTRESDIVARYGGEEFMVALSETGPEEAAAKLETIRLAIANLSLELPGSSGVPPLTASAGVASMPADGITPEELLQVADTRLFQAKVQGRNRVVGARPRGEVADPPTARPGS